MAQYTKRIGGAPVADEVLVTADQETILGSGTALDPLRVANGGAGTFLGQNEGVALVPGMLVQSHSAFTPLLIPIGACVNAAATQAVGITLDASGASSHGPVRIQTSGIVELTTAQWDAAAGTTGGLQGGNTYYQSQATPGRLTGTAPTTGQHQVVAGLALSSTKLLLVISPPSIAA